MAWTSKHAAKWREAMDEQRKRQRRYTNHIICPACNSKVAPLQSRVVKPPLSKLKKNEDIVEYTCPACDEELIVQIHIPTPTYSTYVKKYLEEDS